MTGWTTFAEATGRAEPRPGGRWLTPFLSVVGILLFVGIGVVGYQLGLAQSVRPDSLIPTQYQSADEMAARVGCSGNDYISGPTPTTPTVRSIGWCTVQGAQVTLVVFTSPEAASAWADGVQSQSHTMHASAFGMNWVANSTSGAAVSEVARALS